MGVLAYLTGTLEPALRLLVQGVGSSWLRLAVAAERLAAASQPPPTSVDAYGPRTGVDGADIMDGEHGVDGNRGHRPVDGSVRLRGVSYSYGAAADPVFDALDLTLHDGEHLAVVGPSGVGKSTLADVLAGDVPPDRGNVVLGGAAAGPLTARELARVRVLLPQDAYVFAGELQENLRWLCPRAPERDVMSAVRALGAGPWWNASADWRPWSIRPRCPRASVRSSPWSAPISRQPGWSSSTKPPATWTRRRSCTWKKPFAPVAARSSPSLTGPVPRVAPTVSCSSTETVPWWGPTANCWPPPPDTGRWSAATEGTSTPRTDPTADDRPADAADMADTADAADTAGAADTADAAGATGVAGAAACGCGVGAGRTGIRPARFRPLSRGGASDRSPFRPATGPTRPPPPGRRNPR
ncbi:ATP-binding cassette domain-containing protein [Streptomyces kaempferi]